MSKFFTFLKHLIQNEGVSEVYPLYPMLSENDNYPDEVLCNPLRAEALKKQLLLEINSPQRGGLYWETQIAFAYDSCRIEGIELTEKQTRQLYETRRITGTDCSIDDLVAVNNHFVLFEYMLRTINEPLTKELILRYDGILKSQNIGGLENHQDIGSIKQLPNGVAGIQVSAPQVAEQHLDKLLDLYNNSSHYGYDQMAAFHIRFETIHPLQDGNGRVGRMILFRECLRHNLFPPIVVDMYKQQYYFALDEAPKQLETLIEYLRSCASLYLRSSEPLISSDLLSDDNRIVAFRDFSEDLKEASELLQAAHFRDEESGTYNSLETNTNFK